MRSINLNIAAEAIREAAEIVTHAKLQEALGYLCTWSPDAYPQMLVYITDTTELVACYYKEYTGGSSRPDYVIGAVWHASSDEPGDGHYGFHS